MSRQEDGRRKEPSVLCCMRGTRDTIPRCQRGERREVRSVGAGDVLSDVEGVRKRERA